MFLSDLRAVFHRPALSASDAAEFDATFRERSYHIATLVSLLGAIDGTVLSALASGGFSPQYATVGITLNLAIAWCSPLLLLTLRGRSTRWYPWIICASVMLSNGQYLVHVLQDLFLQHELNLSVLRKILATNSALATEDSPKAQLDATFLQLQIRLAIGTFWITALVQLPFIFSASLASLNFLIYSGMMYLTSTPHDFSYAFVRCGFVVFLGIMVSATVERRERRLFLATKARDHELAAKTRSVQQYQDAQDAALGRIRGLESTLLEESRAAARSMEKAFHDVRNFVTGFGLGLNNYMLARDRGLQAEAHSALNNMRSQSRVASELVEDLFDLSFHQGQREPVALEPVDIGVLIADIVSIFEPLARAKGIELIATTPAEPVFATTNTRDLKRVLVNLVSNAIKFTGAVDGGPASVLVGGERDGPDVVLWVKDTGVGIPEERQQVIWNYGNKTAGTQGESGHGIGLPMVRALCSALPGHQLGFYSQEGEGTEFTVVLPFCEAHVIDCGKIAAAPVAPSGTLAGIKVLLVENDAATRDGECLLLAMLGAEVVSASHIRDALDSGSPAGGQPDLILTDFHLDGDETGAQAISSIRSHWKAPIPAIVVTADRSDEVARALDGLVNVGILYKQLKQDELLSAVTRCMPPANVAA
jgi:signal transduction histidine kinase/CheY-like chemotaxis protein